MNIRVWCKSDRDLIGVERIVTIEIELADGNKDDELSAKIFNQLAENEYFPEDDDWKDMVRKDIAKVAGCNIVDIEVV